MKLDTKFLELPATYRLPPVQTWFHTTRGRLVLQAAGVFVASRALFAAITYYAVALTPARQATSPAAAIAPQVFLAAWNHWDTRWYLAIAAQGYTDPHQAAFFPLYPLAVGVASHLLAGHLLLAGLLVSNTAALAAFCLLALLAYEYMPSLVLARGTLRLFAATPVAFFLAAAYGDALFLALALAALLLAHRRHWTGATVCTFLAALTRISVVALAAALIVEAWPLVPLATWRVRAQIGAALAVAPAGIGLWSLVCAMRFGDPLLWLHEQSVWWLRRPLWPWQSIGYVLEQQRATAPLSFLQARSLLDMGPWILIAAVLIWAAHKHLLPPAWLVYCGVILWLDVAAPVTVNATPYLPMVAGGRYLLAAAPAYIPLARLASLSPSSEWLLYSCSLAAQALALAFFLVAPQAAYGLV